MVSANQIAKTKAIDCNHRLRDCCSILFKVKVTRHCVHSGHYYRRYHDHHNRQNSSHLHQP